MSKKFNSIMLTATAFVLSASMLAACADGVSVEHKHAIYTKEATEATCTHEGNIKHDYCLYSQRWNTTGFRPPAQRRA